jgi:hypothetical protein
MNKSASSEVDRQMALLSAEARKKRLGKKGMSEHMRALANKRHENLDKGEK